MHISDPNNLLLFSQFTEMGGLLVADHPGMWQNVEHARGQVRYYMAKNGDHNREMMAEESRPPLRTPTECRILNMDIETAPMLAFARASLDTIGWPPAEAPSRR